MGYAVKDKAKPKVLPPTGSHMARCYMVMDLGKQEWEWAGEVSEGEKVYIQFELPKKKHVFSPEKGEEPFVIGQEFIVAFGQNAKLRKFLEAWRGRQFDSAKLKTEGFDFQKLIGLPCRISIEHGVAKSTGNPFAKIGAIMPLDEDDVCPAQINKPVYVWLHEEAFDINAWLDAYKWLRETAMKSPDYKRLERAGLTDPDNAYRRPTRERAAPKDEPSDWDNVETESDLDATAEASFREEEEDDIPF